MNWYNFTKGFLHWCFCECSQFPRHVKFFFKQTAWWFLYSHRCSALEPTTAARALTLPQLLTKISLSRHIFGRDHACQSGNLSTYVQVQRAYEIVCTIRQGLTRPKRVRDLNEIKPFFKYRDRDFFLYQDNIKTKLFAPLFSRSRPRQESR